MSLRRRADPYQIPVDGRWALLGQMQMRARATAGTAASALGEILTVEHQHRSLPVARPHSLGPP